MTGYTTLVTARQDDDTALTEALCAHQRRRPRDGRIAIFIPSSWRITAIPSRVYRVEAPPQPWWTVRRAWGRP